MTEVKVGAQLVSKRLPGRFSAQELFVKLRRSPSSTGEQFFERTGGAALILSGACLRIECTGSRVAVELCDSGASPLLDALEHRFREQLEWRDGGALLLDFPRCDDPDEEARSSADTPFSVLRAILALLRSHGLYDPFSALLLGMIGFDHIDLFEALPPRPRGAAPAPDFEFRLANGLVVVEPDGKARVLALAVFAEGSGARHRQLQLARERSSELERRCLEPLPESGRAPASARPAPADISVDIGDEDFEKLVGVLQGHIAAGDIFQVVPSRTFAVRCADSLAAFGRLGAADPSAYRFFLSASWGELFGASPEPAVVLRASRPRFTVEARPLAGTRPRGGCPDRDDRLAVELGLDDKEIAEHMMLVDLARNDIARISHPGTRRVTKLREVVRFATVMHLSSTVEGEIAAGLDAFDVLRACAITGTLSGAPKLRAIELLRAHETSPRGPYGGMAGWINGAGAIDSAVIIRSALVAKGVAHVRAGAGVVHDSLASAEAAETRHKAAAVLGAILGGAQ